jgi:hypothetical protein
MNDEHTCTHCPTDFACGCLASALHVAELCKDLDRRPRLRAAIARTKTFLAQSGWKYPDLSEPCLLAGNDRTVQRLTKDLIDELGNTSSTVKLCATSPFRSQLAEEYAHD